MSDLILERYRPIFEAGSGGFGSVIVAWDTRIQRRVAIKCMELEDIFDEPAGDLGDALVADARTLPGLEEARTAAKLNDSHIVSVYDFEVQDNTAYLILEYIEGISLGDLMAEYPDYITADIVAAVFASIAKALEVAHGNRVLHLDIKPDNVLINRQGQVKVVDFGLARLAGEAGFGAATGGTIGYMPPEQMRQEDLDVRCDEWALASLTYEMIAGENPFMASSLSRAEDKIYDAELVIPSLCLNGLDESIDDIMFCALAPDREQRYDTVADFAHEMKPCLGDARRGKKDLARIVGHAQDEGFEDETSEGEPSDVIGGISPRWKMVFMRLWSVINVALIGYVAVGSFEPIPGWSSPIAWGVMASLCVLSAVIPSVGALIALEFLGVVLMSHDAWISGFVVMVASFAWWFFVGRKGMAQSDTALSGVLFGSFGLAPIAPLLCGYFLRLKDACINAAFVGLLAVVLGGLGSKSLVGWNVFQYGAIRMWSDINADTLVMLQDWGVVILLATWILAALIVSLGCLRRNRLLACCGIVAATALMMGALFVGSSLQQVDFPGVFTVLPTVLAGIVMVVLAAFGVPERPEEEYGYDDEDLEYEEDPRFS